jgi:hypothetical protein
MKRVFWYSTLALVIGAALRLFFVWKFPAGAGDTIIYDQLATNWLNHGKYAMDVFGQPLSVDIRMPGYPAFLAIIYAVIRLTGESAYRAVRFVQIFVDLATCFVVATLAALFARARTTRDSASRSVLQRRVFLAALWLAALCPFTANYVAVPLTETWAIFFTALATFALVLVLGDSSGSLFIPIDPPRRYPPALLAFATGLIVGLGTLFRPETPLLLATALLILALLFFRRRDPRRFLQTAALLLLGAALPLIPWTIRNAVTLHEFQPLTPKDTNLPGELVPRGFMAWERTWLYRVRDSYLVPWKLNDEEIRLDDIPSSAFDTPEQRDRIAAALDTYNEELTLTPEEDAVFAEVARERTASRPLRTYLWIPLRRAVRIWFTPRIELLPVSGHVFPLRYMHEEDPVDQRVTVLFFFLNIAYVLIGLCGAWRLWKFPALRPAVALILLYLLFRTAFLTTLETPEPRYVLVCFPALIAMGAQLFARAPRVLND